MESRHASIAVETAAAPASLPHKVFRCLVAAVLAAGICAPRAWAAPAVSERGGPDYLEEMGLAAPTEDYNASDAYAWEQEALEDWETACEGGSDAVAAPDASAGIDASLAEPVIETPLAGNAPAEEPVVRLTNPEDLPVGEDGEYLCAEDIPDDEIPIASPSDVMAGEGLGANGALQGDASASGTASNGAAQEAAAANAQAPRPPAPLSLSQGALARSASNTAVLGSQKRRAYEGVFRKPGKDPVKD